MTTIVRQAGGLALAAAVAAGSYAIDVGRSRAAGQSAARTLIRAAPERRVALRAVHGDRRSRTARPRDHSGTTRRSDVPTPTRTVVIARTRPVASRTVAPSAPPARPPARRGDRCPVPGDPSPSSRIPDGARSPRAPRVDVEPRAHDRDYEARVDAPASPDRNAPPPVLPTETAPPRPQPPPAPQAPQTLPQPPPMPPPATPGIPPVSPPPPPDGTTAPPVIAPTPTSPPPASPGTAAPVPAATASHPEG